MTHDWLDWLVVAGLAIWFAGTLAYQVFYYQFMPVKARFDPFQLLVGWRLFSNVPRDLRLGYRDRAPDGVVGPWQEVPLRRSHCWHRAVWNPEFVPADARYTWLENFVEGLAKWRPEQVATRPATRALRLTVSGQPWPDPQATRQFEVREVSLVTAGEVRVLFVSDFEPAGGVPAPP